MYIGKNIKYLRCKNGYSQEELSKFLGYKSYTTITKWESGISEPTLKMTNLIADFFGVSVNDLCYKKLWSVETEDKSEQKEPELTSKDEKDIEKRLEAALSDLENEQEALMFSGKPLDDNTRELLKASLENSIRIAKINAKEKYTPKKYKKD